VIISDDKTRVDRSQTSDISDIVAYSCSV